MAIRISVLKVKMDLEKSQRLRVLLTSEENTEIPFCKSFKMTTLLRQAYLEFQKHKPNYFDLDAQFQL